jgi:hypothetical protein
MRMVSRDFKAISFEEAIACGYRSIEAEIYGSKNIAKLNADGMKMAAHRGLRIVGVTDRADSTGRGSRTRRTFWLA